MSFKRFDHFRQRVQERYDVRMSVVEAIEIEDAIQRGKIEQTGKGANYAATYHVFFKGRTIRVLYSQLNKHIITALPGERRKKKKFKTISQ